VIPPAATPAAPRPDRGTDDAELLRRAVDGNGAAFAALYDRHHRHAYAAARRILGPSPAAEDVVQEALLQLWRGGRSYSAERGSLRSWLVVLVRSRAIDLLRREQVRAAATERAGDLLAEHAEELDESAARRELRGHLLAGIVDLPREQSQVVGLQYLAGRSQSEIATALDVPLGTIKSRTRLGLEKLRRQMDGVELAL
jgi:RNA polymerase sigma-70 factor (ECF subfamily)